MCKCLDFVRARSKPTNTFKICVTTLSVLLLDHHRHGGSGLRGEPDGCPGGAEAGAAREQHRAAGGASGVRGRHLHRWINSLVLQGGWKHLQTNESCPSCRMLVAKGPLHALTANNSRTEIVGMGVTFVSGSV